MPILGVTGTQATCESFLAFLKQFGPTKAQVSPNHSVWKVQVSGTLAVAALRAMYADAPVSLDRKHQKAMSLLGWRDKSGRRPRCRPTLL